MTWKPNATVAIIVEDNGRFLMVEELSDDGVSDNIAVLNQPAGHVEQDETLIDACLRETLEETGYHVQLSHFLGIYTWTAPANGITYYRFCFVGEQPQLDPTARLDPDIKAVHWLTADDIQNGSTPLRSPLVAVCLDDYLNHKRYPLDILTELNTQ